MISRSEQFYMLQSFMYAISIHNNQVCEYAKILLQSKTGITYIPLAWTEGGEYFFSRWGYPLKKNNSKCWIPSYTPLSNPPKFPNIVYVYIYTYGVTQPLQRIGHPDSLTWAVWMNQCRRGMFWAKCRSTTGELIRSSTRRCVRVRMCLCVVMCGTCMNVEHEHLCIYLVLRKCCMQKDKECMYIYISYTNYFHTVKLRKMLTASI